ncbi:MAG: hypothetical protein IAI50_12795, partial [Candidatus Eremiobacteraeota bacterium]|nr:hypothetical protein [Candidatus Eremiobacteraeota bacterium]
MESFELLFDGTQETASGSLVDSASEAASFWSDTLRRLRRTPSALLGAAIVAAIVLAALLAPLAGRFDPLLPD